MERGYIQVYTGKGKTTATIGQAILTRPTLSPR